MNIQKIILVPGLIAGLALSPTIFAEGVDSAFEKYSAQGGANFSAAAGEKMWSREVLSAKDNKLHSCISCHTDKLNQSGKHHKTGKPIKPMALSANSERYTKVKKIEKWFKRNCKWSWGRECTPQEKGDFLTYLINYK